MDVDILIIGGGVIGLAIADSISNVQRSNRVLLVEKEDSFGKGTSSRNSEVIHSGIYYPKDSLKAKLCVEGKNLLYRLCSKNNIPHKKTEKLVVACEDSEITSLERLIKQGNDNGVKDLKLLSKNEVASMEPSILVVSAIYSPSTGIIDTHSLMDFFEKSSKSKGVDFAYKVKVNGISKIKEGYEVCLKDNDNATTKLTSKIVINSAGLYCDEIARLAGIDTDKKNYNLVFCKGSYFQINNWKKGLVSRLIYPLPNKDGLGIHLNLTLDDRASLGPDTEYINKVEDYTINLDKEKFYMKAKKFLPFLNKMDIDPEMSGIRPKLTKGYSDFIIKEESDIGLPGFINLLGIESPGLTASPAIGRYVADIVKEILS